ncbi:MAG TPA: hypothetical protein VF190_03680 [Rhodothermales bacterium]
MSTPWTIDTLARFFRMLDDADLHDGFWWRANEPQYEPFKILINCNDLFYWACADCEEVTPENLDALEQALRDVRDVKTAIEPEFISMREALQLFCCRVRGMRPQGAWYDGFPPPLAALFDAAGPNRDGERWNTPRAEYKPGSFHCATTEDPPWKCRSCIEGSPRQGDEKP